MTPLDAKMIELGKRVDIAIQCACGCGKRLLPYDRMGRERSFINGHNVKKYPPDDVQ